jgi:hypothetical protein
MQIIPDESLLYIVTTALNVYRGGIIILERKLEIHPLFENDKKLRSRRGRICIV